MVAEQAARATPLAGPLLRTETGKRIVGDISSGGLGTISGTMAAVPAAEAWIKSKLPALGGDQSKLAQAAQKSAESIKDIAAGLMPNDPNFADDLWSGAASAAMFIPAGAGTGAVVSNIPRMGVLMTKLAPAIGAGVSAVLEASTEAGTVYQDQVKKGLKPEIASKAAFSDFWQNALLVGLTNHFGIFGDKLTGLKKALASAPLEGLQEAGQSILASVAKDEPIDWTDVTTSAGVGALIGGGAGAAVDVAQPKQNVPQETIVSEKTLGPEGSTYLKNKFPVLLETVKDAKLPIAEEQANELMIKSATAGEEALLKGASPEEANRIALEALKESAQPLLEESQAQQQEMAATQERRVARPPMEEILEKFEPETEGKAPLNPQPIEDVSASPLSSSGKRWTADPGSMPGEPALYLDGNATTAKAAVIEEPQDGGGVLYRLLDSNGKNMGAWPTQEEAANAAEKVFPPQGNITPEVRMTKAKEAAEKVLKTNKIDNRVMVRIVDQIAGDETAFTAGRPQAKMEDYNILGATYPGSERVQSLIELANGATEATGRHEAFHAVTNILLDQAEQDVITKKYGDMEKAADAFGAFRTGTSTNDSLIDRAFKKLQEFLEKFSNYLKVNKFTTADELFNSIEGGKFAERVTRRGELAKQYSAEPGAKFIGWQVSSRPDLTMPLYNVPNPNGGTDTFSAETLKQRGIPIPPTPTIEEWKANPKAQYSAEAKSLEDKAITKFGETKNFEDAGFVLSDGRMVDVSVGGEGRLEHRDVANEIYKRTGTIGDPTEKLHMFMKETGAVRIVNYPGHISIEAHGPLSREQLRQIGEHFELTPTDDATFSVVDDMGREVRTKAVGGPTAEDVARFFNGSSAQYSAEPKKQTETKAFKEWFGESKVVDEKGKPLVVYHGSGKSGITVFDVKKAGSILTSDWGEGIYFTPSKWMARGYRGGAVKALDPTARKTWDEFNRAAKEMGTDVMRMSLDLQANKINEEQYKTLQEYENKWRAALKAAEESGAGDVYPSYVKLENPLDYTYEGITDPYLTQRAKAERHDGIIIRNEDGHIDEVVAFNPTQIKSATSNVGTFDPNNPDIRYSAEPKEQLRKDIDKALIPSRRPDPKLYTERMALRRSLQRQSQVAAQAVRATTAELNALKKQISDAVKDQLPAEHRGTFLTTIANAKTSRDLINAMTKLDAEVEKSQRKMLVNSIKRETQRIQASKNIAIDYKQKISAIMNDVLFQRPRASTLERLADLRKFMQAELAKGKNVKVPSYVAERLRLLVAKPLAEFKTTELEDIQNELRTLADFGKTKLRVRQEIDLLNKQKDIADLAHATTPYEKRALARPMPGENLPVSSSIGNAFKSAINQAIHVQEAITPPDVFFDMLDGNQNYTGPNTRIFKSRVDSRFGVYLDELSKLKKEATDKAKGLSAKSMERIGAYATSVQEGGIEKLYNNYGIPPNPTDPKHIALKAELDRKIKGIQLTAKEMEFYKYMRSRLDDLRPRIAETMKNVYNADLGEVKNYFPFVTDHTLMSEDSVQDSILSQMIGLSKTTPKGFTIERTGRGEQKIVLNAFDVFNRHMDDALYLVNTGETIKYLGELANSDDYRKVAGNEGSIWVREWIDTLAKKGGGLGGQQIALLDKLRVNVGMATLGFKLSSALIQITPIGEGATLIGPYAFKGAMRYASSKEWRDFIEKNMPEIRERVGDDPAYREFISEHGIRAKVGEAGYWMIKNLDSMAASSVAAGAYEKYLNDRNIPIDLSSPNQEALAYAERVVRRTQSSPFFKDAPLSLSRGKLTGSRSFDRALFQFQNFVLTNYSLLRHEGFRAGIAEGNISQGASIFMWSMLMAMAGTGLRMGMKELIDFITGREDKKPVPFSDKLWKGAAKEMLGKIPFVSQAMSVIGYGSFPVPSLDWIEKAGEGIKAATTGKKAATRKKGIARTAFALARPLGIPGTLQTEELYRSLISSKKKDR
jgi:hypothetical protein